MISDLELRNFQSHKKTTLNFHPNVNAIVGTSDSGKSAILRGLYWVVYNRPAGVSIISHWNRDKKGMPIDETSALVCMGGDWDLKRIRSSEQNGYIIRECDEPEPIELSAIGLDVPEGVSMRLNIGEVNIQKQMDTPFLLADSAGEVARFFNKEIRLDLIDTILSNAESKRRKYNQDIKQNENALSETEKVLQQFEDLDIADELCNKLKTCETALSTIKEQIATIENLRDQLQEHEIILKKYESLDIESIETIMADVLIYSKTIKEINNNKAEAKQLFDEYEKARAMVESDARQIKQLEKQWPTICPMCGHEMGGDSCAE